ncbi:hypothetical protein ACFLZH_03795 [Patescibacteria group bacterium]
MGPENFGDREEESQAEITEIPGGKCEIMLNNYVHDGDGMGAMFWMGARGINFMNTDMEDSPGNTQIMLKRDINEKQQARLLEFLNGLITRGKKVEFL